jgi:hypothetical protein
MSTERWKLANHVIGRNLFLTKGHLQVVKSVMRTLRSADRCIVRCENQALLNYYVRIISKLLMLSNGADDHAAIDVEIVPASSGDGFLDAINRQIEDVGLEQAVSLTDSSVSRRCLIVTDVENLGRENEEALRYLLKDFPAINLACLFSTSLPTAAADNVLPMFKPALDEHEIEIPGEQILDQIRQAAAGSRNGPSIIKLLDRLFAAP